MLADAHSISLGRLTEIQINQDYSFSPSIAYSARICEPEFSVACYFASYMDRGTPNDYIVDWNNRHIKFCTLIKTVRTRRV